MWASLWAVAACTLCMAVPPRQRWLAVSVVLVHALWACGSMCAAGAGPSMGLRRGKAYGRLSSLALGTLLLFLLLLLLLLFLQFLLYLLLLLLLCVREAEVQAV